MSTPDHDYTPALAVTTEDAVPPAPVTAEVSPKDVDTPPEQLDELMNQLSVSDATEAPPVPADPFLLMPPPELVELLASSEAVERRTQAAQALGKRLNLSTDSDVNVAELIVFGALPLLTACLANDMPVLLQAAAAETLSIMTASSTTDQMALVVQANAVPALVSLLQAKDQNVLESALKALSNIAGDSPRMRDKVIEAGAVPPLLLLLNDASISLTVARHAIFCLSIMCRSKTPRPDWEAVSVALPTLAKLLFTYTDDEEVLTDTAWTLSYLSDGTNDRIQRVIDTGVCARLVELLAHESVAVQTPVLRVAGNIVTGDDMQTQAMLKAGVLDGLCPMLDSRKESIRKEACWTISNITAGTADQVQMVIDTGMVPRLIDLMWREGSNSIQREACWAMTNATERGQEHPEWIEYFVSHGILKGIASFLDGHDRMTDVATSGLENIFKVGADIAADCVNPYALHFKEAGYLDQLVAARESESGGERAAQLCEDFFLGEVGLSEIE